MRKSAALAYIIAMAIGLAACSERDPDSGAHTAAYPGPSVEDARGGADAIGNAAVASAAASEAAEEQ
jgi:putative hemolysin